MQRRPAPRLARFPWVRVATSIYAASGLLLLGLAVMTQDGRVAGFGVAYLLLAAWYPHRFRRPTAMPMERLDHVRATAPYPPMGPAVPRLLKENGSATTKGRRIRLVALAFAVLGLLLAIAASLGLGWVFGDLTIGAWIAAIGLALWAPEDATKQPR